MPSLKVAMHRAKSEGLYQVHEACSKPGLGSGSNLAARLVSFQMSVSKEHGPSLSAECYLKDPRYRDQCARKN